MKFYHVITLRWCCLHAPASIRLNVSCPTWMLCRAAPVESLFCCCTFKKSLLSHTRLSNDTSRGVTGKERVYSVSLDSVSKSCFLLKKRLGRKKDGFLTWDSPDNLRGVPQAHEGELVEPPGANVPNLHWAPLPLVHNLLPGVAVWTGERAHSYMELC